MPGAFNTGHRAKVAWILGGLVTCCGLLGLAVWNLSRIGPAERSTAELYADVQALGVPLDTDAFEKSLEISADQNNAPALTHALESLYKIDQKNAAKRQTARLFEWHDGPALSLSEQSAVLTTYARPLSDVTSHISKPHFVIKRDWVSAAMVRVPEYAQFRLAVKLCGASAVYQAQAGNRSASVASLRDTFKLSALSGDSPVMLISGLVSISNYAIAIQSVVRCIQLDPAGVHEYASTIPDQTVRPVGLYLRSEVFIFVGSIRNLTWQTELATLSQTSEGRQVSPPKYDQRNGPPKDPFVRAEVGYGLKRWLPLMQGLKPDGNPKSKEEFGAMVARFTKDVDNPGIGILGKAFQVMAPMLTQPVKAWDVSDVRRDLARSYAKVVSYRESHGRWPPTLPEAGVIQLDSLSPTPRPFGYRVEPGGMRIWSVGKDGEDNQGLTSQERKAYGTPDAKIDDAFLFRESIAEKPVK